MELLRKLSSRAVKKMFVLHSPSQTDYYTSLLQYYTAHCVNILLPTVNLKFSMFIYQNYPKLSYFSLFFCFFSDRSVAMSSPSDAFLGDDSQVSSLWLISRGRMEGGGMQADAGAEVGAGWSAVATATA